MSTAFTIDFDQISGDNPPSEIAQERGSPGRTEQLGKENGQHEEGSHHDVLAWEVDFTSGSGGGGEQQKPKKMPKFLRDREKARQERMEQMKREAESARSSTSKSVSKSGMRSVSSPQVGKSKIPTPRTTTENRQRWAIPRPASVASCSTQKIKRSPAIKQALLPVKSGSQTRSPERKALSASNSPLSSRSRTTSTKPLVRPASAKTSREMNRQRRSHSIEFNSPPKKEEKKTKEVSPLTSKKVYMYMYIHIYTCTVYSITKVYTCMHMYTFAPY